MKTPTRKRTQNKNKLEYHPNVFQQLRLWQLLAWEAALLSAGRCAAHWSCFIFAVGVQSFKAKPPLTLKPPHKGTLSPSCTPYSEDRNQKWIINVRETWQTQVRDLSLANGFAMLALKCNSFLECGSTCYKCAWQGPWLHLSSSTWLWLPELRVFASCSSFLVLWSM